MYPLVKHTRLIFALCCMTIGLHAARVPSELESSAFANTEIVPSPACLCAAPTGEVFVGVDQNGSLGKDKTKTQQIVRCIDEDNDGVADKFNVFADKVGSIRGMHYDNGKMWVLHPPLLRLFHDDDKDGVADRNEVLVEGLGTPALDKRGADHCTNGFRIGIDGWIYIAIGDFGFTSAKGKDGTELQLYGGGILRVRPDGNEMEIFARGTRNIYDVAVDPSTPANLYTAGEGRGAYFVDHDGDEDVLVTNVGQPVQLFENVTEGAGNWLAVEIRQHPGNAA